MSMTELEFVFLVTIPLIVFFLEGRPKIGGNPHFEY